LDASVTSRASTLRRPLLAACLVLLLAACSKDPSETSTADTSGSTTTLDAHAQGVQFAECMRTNGVTDFPDPDPSGELTIDGVVNGSNLDPDGALWASAVAACKDLEPPGFTGGGARDASEQSAALAFAQCIRDNGVPDFPDPTSGEPLVNTYNIPSSDTEAGMAVLNAAMETCGDLVADLLQGQP
jgi:hypothetical protein